MRKIGIIGLGHVGRLLAHDLVTTDKVDQLVLIDQDDDLAVGLKADLENAWRIRIVSIVVPIPTTCFGGKASCC